MTEMEMFFIRKQRLMLKEMQILMKEFKNQRAVPFNTIYSLSDSVDVLIHLSDCRTLIDQELLNTDCFQSERFKNAKIPFARLRNRNMDVYTTTEIREGTMHVLHKD